MVQKKGNKKNLKIERIERNFGKSIYISYHIHEDKLNSR